MHSMNSIHPVLVDTVTENIGSSREIINRAKMYRYMRILFRIKRTIYPRQSEQITGIHPELTEQRKGT